MLFFTSTSKTLQKVHLFFYLFILTDLYCLCQLPPLKKSVYHLNAQYPAYRTTSYFLGFLHHLVISSLQFLSSTSATFSIPDTNPGYHYILRMEVTEAISSDLPISENNLYFDLFIHLFS